MNRETAPANAGGPSVKPAPKRTMRVDGLLLILSLGAIALALFLSGGEVLHGLFQKDAVDVLEDYRSTIQFLSHPIQTLAERPLAALIKVLFYGGLLGFFGSFEK